MSAPTTKGVSEGYAGRVGCRCFHEDRASLLGCRYALSDDCRSRAAACPTAGKRRVAGEICFRVLSPVLVVLPCRQASDTARGGSTGSPELAKLFAARP